MNFSSFFNSGFNSGFNSNYNSGYPSRTARVFLVFLLILICIPTSATAQEKIITNNLEMTFILVEPGSFLMGSPKTEPFRDADEIHGTVKIKTAFYLQATEVTLKQWRALMGKEWFKKRKGTDHMPITQVSYYDCIRFIDRLNAQNAGVYRLPTDMEWEYACRAGTKTAYSWGDDIDCSKAMYGNNPKKDKECIPFLTAMKIDINGPAPVKSFPPNPWGFYDMHGNVWEWCSDKYGQYQSGTGGINYNPVDSDSRVRRGGSWYKHGYYLRSANR
ncbi:MAG: formylglycine-generating enzyme family protein, partial [Proteobacteria bacterium]|nr:formylglycine-generating enzyme family protein [Desulfobacula sp.]MBU4129971.1 formylglycine-generating enzyme family protein [Pseudomonadota bacterium]